MSAKKCRARCARPERGAGTSDTVTHGKNTNPSRICQAEVRHG